MCFFTSLDSGRRKRQQRRAIGHLVADLVQNFFDHAIGRRGDGVLHFHRFHDDQRVAALDALAFCGQHRHHLARHWRGQAATGLLGFSSVRHWIIVDQSVVCAIGKHMKNIALAQHAAVHG